MWPVEFSLAHRIHRLAKKQRAMEFSLALEFKFSS